MCKLGFWGGYNKHKTLHNRLNNKRHLLLTRNLEIGRPSFVELNRSVLLQGPTLFGSFSSAIINASVVVPFVLKRWLLLPQTSCLHNSIWLRKQEGQRQMGFLFTCVTYQRGKSFLGSFCQMSRLASSVRIRSLALLRTLPTNHW